jgi:hypothetical protein
MTGIAIAASMLAVECGRYLLSGVYLDHIEGNVVIIGWQYLHGAPLYQVDGGLPRLATFYGPLAYLAESGALALFGANIAAGKAASLLALVATVVIMAVYLVRHADKGDPLSGLFLLLASLALFAPMSFWVRPDPFETLLVAAAVAAGGSRRRILWTGICIGLAVNLKIHAFVYFLPVLADLSATRRLRAAVTAVILALIVFAAPFAAPGVSFADYAAGLAQQVGGRPPESLRILAVLIFVTVLLLPVAAAFELRAASRRTRLYALATLATLGLLIYPALFPGAGPYHFLPLTPVLADLRFRLSAQTLCAALAPLVVLLGAVLPASYVLHELSINRPAALASREAVAAARQGGGGAVQIGYGESRHGYMLSQLSRVKLALAGAPVLLDAQVLMELARIGDDASTGWVARLDRCEVRGWLIPKGEAPFALISFFYDRAALFDRGFRNAFLANYRLTSSTANFDLWDCAPR